MTLRMLFRLSELESIGRERAVTVLPASALTGEGLSAGEQHWLELMQLEPCGRQEPSPHSLLVHCMLQHSIGPAQAWPSILHIIVSVQTLA